MSINVILYQHQDPYTIMQHNSIEQIFLDDVSRGNEHKMSGQFLSFKYMNNLLSAGIVDAKISESFQSVKFINNQSIHIPIEYFQLKFSV